MWKECVDTSDRFGGVDLVEFIFVPAVFLLYGEKTVAGEMFDGNGRRRAEHADAQHQVVERVDERDE